MSYQAASAALNRMHMQPVLSFSFSVNALSAAMHKLSQANPEAEQKAAAVSRVETAAYYGLTAPAGVNKPFAFANGIAIIPIQGALINRFGACWGYVTGYNFIRAQMNAAAADPDVKGIIFDINSPGGEAAGCFELASEIFALEKPTLGVVDSNAYSGAYALLSAMDKKVVTPSGGVGSVGVITMHVNEAKWLEKLGIEITLIYSGEHKADGNPFEALPTEVKKNIQASVDGRREEFSALVAGNLGVDVKVIKDTEAQVYRAKAALELGLIDAVATPAEAVAAFLTELSGSTNLQENSMATQNANADTPGAKGSENANVSATQEQVDAARKTERDRIATIMSCEEAKGRQKQASHLALNTSISLEDAKGILAASAVEAAAAPAPETNQLENAMGKESAKGNNPGVGADPADAGANGDKVDVASRMLKNHAMATGRTVQ